jgi:outer membrane protein OmpA-like peptidoglycan-associated protein
MKKIPLTPVLIAIAILVGACSTAPRTTSELDQTRNDFVAAQNNPNVTRFAPLELQQASVALDAANAAANHDDSVDKIDKLAYIAKQKIAVAQEVAKQKYAEAEIARSAKERDQMRLDQRTNEANQAKNNAAQAQLTAEVAVGVAAEADRKTREAERVTADAQAHAAQLQAQLDDLAAKKTDRGMVITLGDVLFGTDQARLNPDGMHTVQKLADVLQQNPQRSVLVEGFTDSTGNAPHNQELSERRATAVRSALAEMGIAGDRVAIHGYGQAYPVAANDTSSNRQLNRRVEIVLSDDSGKILQR